jgi:hypothetical protein
MTFVRDTHHAAGLGRLLLLAGGIGGVIGKKEEDGKTCIKYYL